MNAPCDGQRDALRELAELFELMDQAELVEIGQALNELNIALRRDLISTDTFITTTRALRSRAVGLRRDIATRQWLYDGWFGTQRAPVTA